MNKDLEGLEYLARMLTPLDVIKVYHDFKDKYIEKHYEKLKNEVYKPWIDKRSEVWERYVRIHYSTEAIIKRELKTW